jgi:hypothetical protein
MEQEILSRKVRILSNWVFPLTAMVVLSVFVTIFFASRSISRQTDLEKNREICENAAHQLLAGTDILNTKLAAYVDTANADYMVAYWEEADVTQSRENAYGTLCNAGISVSEKAILDQAMKSSYDLTVLETHIMRMVSDYKAIPLSEMPESVAAYVLPPLEETMTPEQKWARAKELAFGRSYASERLSVLNGAQNFSYQFHNRAGVLAFQNSRQTWIIMVAGFSLYVMFLLVLLLLYRKREHLRQRDLHTKIEAARVRDTILHLALHQLGEHLIRYDIEDGLFSLDGEDSHTTHDMTELLLDYAPLSAAAAEQLSAFCAAVHAGDRDAQAVICVTDHSSRTRYLRFESMVLDKSAVSAPFAVITFFDCTEQRERDLAYSRIRQQYDSLPTEKIALYEYNLSRGVYERSSGGLAQRFPSTRDIPFNERTRAFAKKYVASEDRAAFALFMNRERLLGAYQDGRFTDHLDFRLRLGGDLRWYRIMVQMVPYPDSQNVKLYTSMQDIHEEKQAELQLIERAERDSLTGVFNRSAFFPRVNMVFRDTAEDYHAILLLDVDNFKTINDRFGHDAGDIFLRNLTNRIRHELRSDDLIGRLGGDEFLICLVGFPSSAAVM